MISMLVSENEWSKILSPLERAVALLIGGGLSNKEVARELGLSVGTVKIHVHNIFQKLNVRKPSRPHRAPRYRSPRCAFNRR
jgi:DNA-binding NarL/FixJ family response regulator